MPAKRNAKPINLALQGGGAHGAFTWGVLDRILEDGRLDICGLSGTSAGAMNAAVFAYGKMIGGPDGARDALTKFWYDISEAGRLYSPVQQMPWEVWMRGFNMDQSPAFALFEAMSRTVSPYQFNPFDFNPLRDVVDANIDFDALATCPDTKLFIGATCVNTGKVRVFDTEEVSLDVLMASACLPFLFKAVEIDGSHYWDGGYSGNPVLFPFFYHTDCDDILIIHVNPIVREEIPTSATDIMNRVNEISFNGALIKELRAIAFVRKLLDEGWLKDEYADRLRKVLVHSVRADDVMIDLSVASKFNVNWDFLTHLRDRGRTEASKWLEKNVIHVGERSTVDVREEFLDIGSPHIG